MAATFATPPQNQQPITELLISAIDEQDEDQSDLVFESDSPKSWRIGLFWHTFGLLALLLAGSTLAGYWLLRSLDDGPRIRENARQIAATVTLTRSALLYAESAQRWTLVGNLMQQERTRIFSRTAADRIEPFDDGDWAQRLTAELRDQLGHDAVIARSVNGQPGLWVGFAADSDAWWLWFERERAGQSLNGSVWLIWFVLLVVLMLVGAALFARLVNRPFDALAGAAMRVREGDYASVRLDETVHQSEVYAVNVRFNRMAEQLARVEQERMQMLAGISHDLRTPLARLRLEIEMCVSDEEARERMSDDIHEVGITLNKFLEYARPSGHSQLHVVDLGKLASRCARGFAGSRNMSVQVDVPARLYVLADEGDLSRAITNLLENASHYGKTPGTGFTHVRIAATVKDGRVMLRVRDHGAGVPQEQIMQITRPFYRGDAARKNAVGAGLGLAIVERMIKAMGGDFKMINANSGGLQAVIRLPLAGGSQAQAGGDSGQR